MRFQDIDQKAADIANMTFAKREYKEMLRDSIIDFVALACLQYSSDDTFKRDVNEYLRWRQNNIALKSSKH